MRIHATFLLAAASFAVPVAAQDTLRFEPTVGYATVAVREPVARIQPGTVLISRTNHGAYYDPGGGAFPGEVGPFYIEGATTNDVLVVEVLRVRPNHDLAAAQLSTSEASPPTVGCACSTNQSTHAGTSGGSTPTR